MKKVSTEELVKEVIADGEISASEVEMLDQSVFEDGKASKEEVEQLFKAKDNVTNVDPSFTDLLVKTVVAFALNDDDTPGVVSKEEGDFISSLITSDGTIDAIEKEVLLALKEKATSIESEALTILIDSL